MKVDIPAIATMLLVLATISTCYNKLAESLLYLSMRNNKLKHFKHFS